MNLPEFLIRLKSTVRDQREPLIAVDRFVPRDTDDQAADREASRRMVAAVVYWLVAFDRVAHDIRADRAGVFASILTRPSDQAARVVEDLGDVLFGTDLAPGWRRFAAEYGFATDYYTLFVKAPDRLTLRDAAPTHIEYAELACLIESRAEGFRQGATDWRDPIVLPDVPRPRLWRGGSKEEWLSRLATYEDLMATRPREHRTRVDEYWSLVDHPPTPIDADVAAALVRTCLWVSEYNLQQPVLLALRECPPATAVRAVLPLIVDLEARTDYAGELAGLLVLRPHQGDVDLEEAVDALKAAPAEQRNAYLRALRHDQEDDWEQVAQTLERLGLRAGAR